MKAFACHRLVQMLLAAGLPLTGTMAATATDSDHVDVFVAERLVYDDNLFRLPAAFAASNLPPTAEFRRDELTNRISIGLDGRWLLSRQAFDLVLTASDNRFQHNPDLDHVSGKGQLIWEWRSAGDWSGRAGTDFERSLASFANSRLFIKDLLDTLSYFGDARLGIGSRWAVQGGVRHVDITHSATARQFDDYQGDTGSLALEYLTPASTLLAADYRHTAASFPRTLPSASGSLEGKYSEDTPGIRIRYAPGAKVVLEGTAGYLRRDYADPTADDFSGDVWRLSLYWQPGVKMQVAFSGWRDLKAYADAESDYFTATGASIAPVWSITEKVKVQLTASWEQQDYLGSNPGIPDSIARRDEVASAQLQITYLPRKPFEVMLGYRQEQRESNRPTFAFDDAIGNVGLRFLF